jgi:hypothetical protein
VKTTQPQHLTRCLCGNHVLSTDFINPIELDSEFDYGLALIGFHSFNSIPNIEEGENKFYYTDNKNQTKEIVIPTGSYEISDIESYLRRQIIPKTIKKEQYNQYLSLKPNNNTLKCEVESEHYRIDFTKTNTIARILGFSKRTLEPKQLHESDLPVDIVKVRTVQINCNITTGAFYNHHPSHSIYEFAIGVNPGFAIDETPRNLCYLPIINKREIPNITLNIVDQNFKPVNFRGEKVIVRLELKKL